MQKLNILVVGNGDTNVLSLLSESKYLNKIYTTFESERFTNIRYNTFRELALKCKSLKIDIVLVEDKKLILQGIADVLRANFINCIALTSDWTKLVLSSRFARNIAEKYGIAVPEKFKYPKIFPLVLRADGKKEFVNSMTELIEVRKNFLNAPAEITQTIYLEQFLEGEKYILTSFFDGKNIVTFQVEGLSSDLISEYNKKLKTMFVNEGANFIGYINSEVILSDGILYNIGFNIDFPQNFPQDMLYIFVLAIYQKLNEL